MRIVVLVESLTFGGAERQACILAGEFKRRGHDVCVATYHRDDFYRALLEREQVEHHFLGGKGKVAWALNVRQFLRTHGQDVVLAFLPGPSAYAELAGLPKRTWGLVVSERSSGDANRSWFKTYLHNFADCIVTNSHSARLAIQRKAPRLRAELVTIYNAVRIEEPSAVRQGPLRPTKNQEPRTGNEVRLVVAASLDRNKNPQGLLRALHILRASHPSLQVRVDWYGSQKVEPELLPKIRQEITGLGLEQVFHLHPATDHIHDVMSEADAVVLPSFYEGLPNAVCEGMMLGKPILMSDVCDARSLVQGGINGFLFDPRSPESIAHAIARFAGLAPRNRVQMGMASRAQAQRLFETNTVAEHYLRLFGRTAQRNELTAGHWRQDDSMRTVRDASRAIVFVDRFRQQTGSYPPQAAGLIERLGARRWAMQVASSEPARISFLFDMLAALVGRRRDYSIACISVFSGPAFIWAEAATVLLRLLGKPYIAVLRGGNLPSFAERWPGRVRSLLSAAALVAAPSRYLQISMCPYRSDIRLLPNAIDLPSYTFRVRANPSPRLIWLRAFQATYNPDLALSVLARLLPECQEASLVMVGPDKGDGSLQAFRGRARELRLESHVEYAGLVRKPDVPAWLDRGDIFINTTNVDNTPVSVIEAMACGLCIVSTNVGGVPYLLEHEVDALLVPPNDAEAMAVAVRRILSEPGLAEKLSRNARMKAECFDWQVVLPQWESLFEEVLERA